MRAAAVEVKENEFERRARVEFDSSFWSGMRPDPILTVSEWSDQHRILPKIAAEPGRWRTSRTPYLREIMDCLSSMSEVQEVVFMKSAQIGGTEAGNNWIGYVIDHCPGAMMLVQPTLELAKRNSKTRIKSLIDQCPPIRDKVKSARSRDSGNTILAKEFPGGVLVMAGANSAVSLRSMPARFLMLDEIDGYPDDVDGEGDPVVLAEKRTTTFIRKKIYKVSTPTFEGRSKIAREFEKTDQRRYHVPCPKCHEMQILKWSQVRWPEGTPLEAVYVCEHCQTAIVDYQKTWMLEHGEWRADKPGRGGGKRVGFHINALYSPYGLGDTFGQLAQKFVEAQGKPEVLRGFTNTELGETWKEKSEAPDWQRLHDRREQYAVGSIPGPVVFLTAGVDVQKDRLEVEVVGWTRTKASWSIDYIVIPGDTALDSTWERLTELLSKTWEKKLGDGAVHLPIQMMAVDTGYNTQHVYNWVRKRPPSQVMATKGVDQAALMVGQPSAVDVTRAGKRIRRGLRLWPIGVGIAKGELYSWLKLNRPTEEEQKNGISYPPGYCHFPEYGEEYFKQLTSEQLVVRIVKGNRRYVWEKTRDRNEALDCRVLARAAAAVYGIDRFSQKHWDNLSSNAGAVVATQPKSGSDQKQEPTVSSGGNETPRRKSSFWK
jgi:phage terminase large subunit GpA-like protein